MERLRVGVVGCGRISGQYLENLARRFRYCIEVVALADLVPELAQKRAGEFEIPRVCSTEELMADPSIELVVDLTMPGAHYEVNHAALVAGKHVYGEKPFTITVEDGRALLKDASQRGLRIGGAPDTFLGAALQTSRKLIDDGWIGTPITAAAFLAVGGFGPGYYDNFRGPVYDMGPYYLTALVSLLGPVRRVAGVARTPFPEKTIQDPKSDHFGEPYRPSTPGNVAGVLEFEGGVLATVGITSETFGYFPRLEIHGSDGILTCSDPNGFGGPIFLQPRGGERREVPLVYGWTEANRGLGVADMAYAIRTGRSHRASGDLCCHVLEIAHALHDSSASAQYIELPVRPVRPAPLPPGTSGNPLAA